MSDPLILALPSKGRLKEQCADWLASEGLELVANGDGRGYSASLKGVDGVIVNLLSAGSIAAALDDGEAHLGVTGEDLIRERGDGIDDRVILLRPLGFGRADVVVALPEAWLDVESMADLDEVAHDFLARTGGRLRVATKYAAICRAFFAKVGIVDYRIVHSAGATEGAPAAGSAEIIIDITSTGSTLKANNLKVPRDGVILESEANLAASLTCKWTAAQKAAAKAVLASSEFEALTRALG